MRKITITAVGLIALCLMLCSCEGQQIDATTQILAENVVLESHTNALKSDNLQDALDNEMAIDLEQLLPGTTWEVSNRTRDELYEGFAGQITFSDIDDTFTIDSGRFAAAGILHPSEDPVVNEDRSAPAGPVSFEILSNSVMYFRWDTTRNDEDDAIITIVVHSKASLVMVGQGGSGLLADKISVLSKQ